MATAVPSLTPWSPDKKHSDRERYTIFILNIIAIIIISIRLWSQESRSQIKIKIFF